MTKTWLGQKAHLVMMLVFGLNLLASGVVGASSTVHIPDANLKQAIRDELDKPTEDITRDDMEGITVLNAFKRGIEDLTGLAYAVNLQELILTSNQISNINALSDLEALQILEIDNNQISDMSAVANLTKLEWLSIGSAEFGGNPVSDISPVANLTNLKLFSFSNNQVIDITPIENLTGLQLLVFWNNAVSDITPVANLTNLETLSFVNNDVSDLDPLANLKELELLQFAGNHVENINALANLEKLERLSFHGNRVKDISPLGSLTNLKHLAFPHNRVEDITPLENLTNLEVLSVRNNYIDITVGSDAVVLLQQLMSQGVYVDYEPQIDIPVERSEPVEGSEEDVFVKMTIGDTAYEINQVPAVMDAAPFIDDDRTFVPASFVARAFSLEADWGPKDTKTEWVTFQKDDVLIEIRLGFPAIKVTENGIARTVTNEAAPQIVKDRTYLPLRAVGEIFGATFDWGPKESRTEWVSFKLAK